MWIAAFDPKDERAVAAGDEEHWARRHGTPLRSREVLWVDSRRVPVLRAMSEGADLYMIHVPDTDLGRSQAVIRRRDTVPDEWRDVLNNVALEHVAVAVEFTYHSNWSTNCVERLRIVHESVSGGIPTIYALPAEALALRGTERRGDRNRRQRSLSDQLAEAAERLVRENKAVNLDSLRRATGSPLNLGRVANNRPDPKVSLFCLALQDSHDVPCATAQLAPVITVVPNTWKLAGRQLATLFRGMRGAMEYMETHGHRANGQSDIFRILNDADRQLLRDSPPPRMGHRNRSATWDARHRTIGFSPASWIGVGTRNPTSAAQHYSLHLPRLMEISAAPTSAASLERLLVSHMPEGKRWRLSSRAVPPELLRRDLGMVYLVSPYAGTRGAPRWQNADERTYMAKLLLVDYCGARNPVETNGRPRAVSTLPKERRHLLAVQLPMPSSQMFPYYDTNARYRTWMDFADILLFEDAAFLGLPWSGEQPKLLLAEAR